MSMKHALDRLDVKILAALQREGRITKLALSQDVGLSPSACLERMKRLEDAGLVRGYMAELNPSRIARSATVFTEITLSRHGAADFQFFETRIQSIPEIVECHATGGGIDYILKLICRDIQHYQQLIDSLLEAEIGIGRYFTYVVTKPVKRYTGLPLDSLLAGDPHLEQ
ncbi:Lrp/AsnC family transcriptional regulator [Fodinicurvata sp. EGI_FJ10296]|uniref:Lrp/AsnC family transcriptional regulator n=1 Tax=Fodinicurvata sp. EGI_FJ10296 TaxID=3231908 RepID=UPI003453AD1C